MWPQYFIKNFPSIIFNGGYGINSDRELWKGCCYGQHAEMNILNNIRKMKRSIVKSTIMKRQKINIIVLRVNGKGQLSNSRPCFKCLEYMSRLRGITIKNIYYSDSNDTITIAKFKDLYCGTKHYSKRFR